MIRPSSSMTARTCGTALGCLPGVCPEIDRGDLRDLPDVVQDVKELMVQRDVDDGIVFGREGLADLIGPPVERAIAPEVVGPEEPALQSVVAERRGFGIIEERTARLSHHDERAAIEQRIRELQDDM